jgi:two-component system CitB family sensor kinase
LVQDSGKERIEVRRVRAMSTVITSYVLVILVLTMLLGFALYSQVTRRMLAEHTERTALAVAESVAADPSVRSAMAAGDPNGSVRDIAEEARRTTGAAYIVVIDREGVRHSHPNPALIGKPIEEPVVALDGRTHVGIDPGSLGRSANGKAPLRAPDGRLIGEVSVGFLERDVSRQLWDEIPVLLLYTGLALGVGVLASLVLARRLKRMTFGLELHDLAALLQEREAMLHGIREGVVAFDPHGRLRMANDEARRLLSIRGAAFDEELDALLPPGRLRDLLSGQVEGTDQLVLTDEHLLVVNRMPIQVDGRNVGAVVTLRDRTELEALVRELDSVTGLTDALRAQQHEFSNRLHVLSVLVGMGDQDEASAYLREITATSTGRAEDLRSRISPPALAALLLAKITIASERGITVELTEDSSLDGVGTDPQALLTVVGNLVDNAMDAVADTPPPRRITVRIGASERERAVRVQVTDTGPGISPELATTVFQDGFSTKPPRAGLRRGLGLALVHRMVTQRGGRIEVGSGPGGDFDVVIPLPSPGEADDQIRAGVAR